MEERPEAGSVRSSEQDESPASNWVLSPDGSYGSRAELATFTKASRMTPETLRLLQEFMTKVQEAGDGEEGDVLMRGGSCGELTSCGAFNHGGGGCGKLKDCFTFKKLL